MTPAPDSSVNTSPIHLQPNKIADHLSYNKKYCLFLDIDGTLAKFTLDPKDSHIPNSTLLLLQDIQSCGVSIAIVTGRSFFKAKQMLYPMQLPIAASHGLEIVPNNGLNSSLNNDESTTAVPVDPSELNDIKQIIIALCAPYADFTLEDKPYSVALHYRQNPALADVAYNLMEKVSNNYPNWCLKQGKFVWEIVPEGVNKGTAILTLLQGLPAVDTLCPIFLGDDITDEAGFLAVQNPSGVIDEKEGKSEHYYQHLTKGMGIKVGEEPTYARYYVNDTNEVVALLSHLLAFFQTQARHSCCSNSPALTSVNPLGSTL